MTTQQQMTINIVSIVGYAIATSTTTEQAWKNAGSELMTKFNMTQDEAADAIRFSLSILDK